MYEKFGFEETTFPEMRLVLERSGAAEDGEPSGDHPPSPSPT